MNNYITKTKTYFAGFTLMEMVVTMGIFALVATLMLANFRQGQKTDDLRRGALELAGNIRKVQTLGMSGQVASICVGNGPYNGKNCQIDDDCNDEGSSKFHCESSVPSGGYGLNLQKVEENSRRCSIDESNPNPFLCPTSYTLFVDSSETWGKYDPNSPSYDFALPGSENYALPSKLFIIDYAVQCSWGQQGYGSCAYPDPFGLDITFRPPKPTPYFFTEPGPAYSQQTVKILLKHADTGLCRQITINGVSGDVSDEQDDNCQIDW